MLISILLAWAAVVCSALTAAKFLARISGSHKINFLFARWHNSLGMGLLLTGLIHGILAGNPAGADLSQLQLAPVLFTWNWGSVCILLAICLFITYSMRKMLPKVWMRAHRLLTILLLLALVLHLTDVGIQLPRRISDALSGKTVQVDTLEDTTGADLSSSTFSGAVLQDGVYEGSAEGYRGTITVSVTVADGAVSDITVLSESDTPQYFTSAESILDSIQSQQSLNVDTITGATFSSAGLLNAVKNALEGAIVSGELASSEHIP